VRWVVLEASRSSESETLPGEKAVAETSVSVGKRGDRFATGLAGAMQASRNLSSRLRCVMVDIVDERV
jgi:hypothetical protein